MCVGVCRSSSASGCGCAFACVRVCVHGGVCVRVCIRVQSSVCTCRSAFACVRARKPQRALRGHAVCRMLSTPRPPRRRVAQIILHPEFLQTTLVNDVALLKLATPIPAASLLPVALNTDAAWELQGVPLVAAGWGVTSEDSQTVSSSLQEVTLGVVRTALLDALRVYYRSTKRADAQRQSLPAWNPCLRANAMSHQAHATVTAPREPR